MSPWRVGMAIVLTCFFMAGYGRHRKLGVGFCTAGTGFNGLMAVRRENLYFYTQLFSGA